VGTSSLEAKHKVKGRLLLDVVILESAAILELLASEDQTLLVWRDSLLVLDLSLDGIDGVTSLDLEGDGLAREGLNENLHPSCATDRLDWVSRRRGQQGYRKDTTRVRPESAVLYGQAEYLP